ncbi:MAG: right-handed parallel beta-helix repeat-containing protein [Acidimicrobiales bacterium]
MTDGVDGGELDEARLEHLVSDPAPSRRRLLKMGVAAGAATFGALGAAELLSPSSGASGSAIDIDSVNTGTAGGVTVLEYTSGTGTLGSLFRAAVQDWGGQVFNVKAYGAVGDGSTDDTAAIVAAQAAAGAGCVLFPAGTYLVGGLSIATAGQAFKIEAGAKILAKAAISGPVITVSAASVTILGPGTVDGNVGAQTATTGLDGIQLTAGADDALVHDVTVQNAAWLGIESDNANRARIVLNRVLGCNHGGISVVANSGPIDGPSVHGNRVFLSGSSLVSGINVQGNNATNLVSYPEVSSNQVDVASGIGIQVANCNFPRVVNNRGKAPSQVFSVVGGTDAVVQGNTALATGSGAGIELGSNYSLCVGNTVLHSGNGAGIHADNASGTHIVISNNKITGAVNCGIGVGSYDHVTITGNIVHQSTSASASFSVIQVLPTGAGLVVIGDNICDAAGASPYAIWLNNLTSVAIQTLIHDNAITGVPLGSSNAAFRFSGAGVVTDMVVHDNTIGSGITVYTVAPGLSLGGNVRFHDNIVVGPLAATFGVSPLSLPPSGTAYTNPGPYTELVYLQGGKLAGTGTAQGVMKDGRVIVAGTIILKTPLTLSLQPGESFTAYYSVAPNAFKDVKS